MGRRLWAVAYGPSRMGRRLDGVSLGRGVVEGMTAARDQTGVARIEDAVSRSGHADTRRDPIPDGVHDRSRAVGASCLQR